TNITQRLRELSIQSSNGTLGSNDRTYLNSEATQLLSEFDRIATQTQFNGSNLLDGSFTTTNIQVGIQKGQTISFNIGNARTSALGALATLSGGRDQITSATNGLIINGKAINNSSAADDTFSASGNSYSAIAIAKNINLQSGSSKVFADVQTTIVQGNNLSFSSFGGDLSADAFKINGISVLGTGVNNLNAFIAAVNNYSSQTGVQARLQTNATSSIEFFANDGRNIQIAFSANAATTGIWASFEDGLSSNVSAGGISAGLLFSATGVSVGTNIVRTGAIKLRSSGNITISGSNTSNALGFASTTVTVDSTIAVNSIVLTDQNSASNALSVLDATLTQLNGLRSGIGATQSRLDSTINSLGVTLENISSAKSQIKDTDVAAETAELTRAQILQQAGVAVLGQANASSQTALTLLKSI
ncbi:MAG: flagellin domain protein, partial [Bacteriovoracaceae bacterium]|nr:flagellin domain protein [Bacteriovoracaceae bacterium]